MKKFLRLISTWKHQEVDIIYYKFYMGSEWLQIHHHGWMIHPGIQLYTDLWVDSLELVKHSTRVISSLIFSEVRRCKSTNGLYSRLHFTVHCPNCFGKVNAVSRLPLLLLWRALATVKSMGRWRLRAARCSGFWVMVAEKRSFCRGEVVWAAE